QTIALMDGANPTSPQTVRTVATAGVKQLPGVPYLAYRGRRGPSWQIGEPDDAADLEAIERQLEDAYRANPTTKVPAVAADVGTWGRTLVLRFPLGAGGADGALVEAIRLDPLYDHLFLPNLRGSYV